MTGYFIFWGSVILIGILIIMSGYNKASTEEKEKKKANAKLFVIVIIILLICGALGLCDSNYSDDYQSDPSMWIHNARS